MFLSMKSIETSNDILLSVHQEDVGSHLDSGMVADGNEKYPIAFFGLFKGDFCSYKPITVFSDKVHSSGASFSVDFSSLQ